VDWNAMTRKVDVCMCVCASWFGFVGFGLTWLGSRQGHILRLSSGNLNYIRPDFFFFFRKEKTPTDTEKRATSFLNNNNRRASSSCRGNKNQEEKETTRNDKWYSNPSYTLGCPFTFDKKPRQLSLSFESLESLQEREPDRLIYEKVIPLMQSTFGIWG
jgi:hypothetical protein